MSILIHYSKQPLKGPIHSVPLAEQKPDFKPKGFWVSVEDFGDTWRDWCEAEGFALDRLACRTKVILAADADILELTTVDGIDWFTEEFLIENEFLRTGMDINWPVVAERWQGILIAPYQWDRRLDGSARWYYAWDCASGCIWDAKAIVDVRVMERTA